MMKQHQAAAKRRHRQLDVFTDAYFVAALWAESDDQDRSLDENYGIGDFAPATRDRMIADAADFQARFGELIQDDDSPAIEKWGRWEMAGHDFWLSRRGHGAGFFDGDWPKHGDELQAAAESYGDFELYVSDDGMIYAVGHETATEARPHRRPVRARGASLRRVADFSTLPEIVQHAHAFDGATHVAVDGARARLYYPAHGGYEEGKVWPEHGYWHAPAPSARSFVQQLPPRAEPIKSYLSRQGRRAAAAPARRRGGSPADEGAMQVASRVVDEINRLEGRGPTAGAGHAHKPQVLPGGFRWSEPNESAIFTTASPEHVKVVVVLSEFHDGTYATTFFSSESLSETDRFENVTHFTYDSPNVREMVGDVEWVWKTVDEYKRSWEENGGEVEARRRPSSPMRRRAPRLPAHRHPRRAR